MKNIILSMLIGYLISFSLAAPPQPPFLLDVHNRIVRTSLEDFVSSFKLQGLSVDLVKDRNKFELFKVGILGTIYFNDLLDFNFRLKIDLTESKAQSYYESNLKLKTPIDGKKWFIGGIFFPDIFQSKEKARHFDDMNYDQIIKNLKKIHERTSELINQYNVGNINALQLGFEVGRNLHSIEDLYSHSNYVELFRKHYGKGVNSESIPILDDVLASADYAAFVQLLKNELKTGFYPGKGPGSHREMNHDIGKGANALEIWIIPETSGDTVTPESIDAENIATNASADYLYAVVKLLKK